MIDTVESADLTNEQQQLWARVESLWAASQSGDHQAIEAAVHPDYVGWDLRSASTHDRAIAVGSVTGDAPRPRTYRVRPHSIQVYEHRTGVVHYSYAATVVLDGDDAVAVTGRWTEVYSWTADGWVLVAVSGRPD